MNVGTAEILASQEHQKELLNPVIYGGGSVVMKPPANAGDTGLISGSGRSPGEGNGNPLQYSHLENSVDRGAWQAIVHSVAKSQTSLSD